MCGNSMRENREALQTPTHDGVGRSKKAKSRNVDMHVCGESDGLVVPTKRANKAGAYALAAGVRRGKEGDQGERTTSALAPDTEPGMRVTGFLWRVRQAARRDRQTRWTALLHHVTPELLRASYWELNHKAVPGIDGGTWTEYRKPLVARIGDLHERVQRGTYRAKPSKRAWT
jgi:hypothetical protein